MFFEQNSQTHCERCYQELFCPRCGHCEKPVMDRCITALGKKWHVDHFICTQCLNPFNGGNFFERDGRPYCETDFFNLFAPKCASCNEAIKGDCINALGSQVGGCRLHVKTRLLLTMHIFTYHLWLQWMVYPFDKNHIQSGIQNTSFVLTVRNPSPVALSLNTMVSPIVKSIITNNLAPFVLDVESQ